MLINPYEPNWLNVLHGRATALDDGLSQYLLLDGVFTPGLYLDVRAITEHDAVTLLFETLPGCDAKVRDVSPFLFKYDATKLREIDKALKKCDGWPMVSAISTTETLAELTARLAAWCVVYADKQRFNFRFPDTRRLPGIFSALTPTQQGQLAGPAKVWSYINRAGVWSDLPLTATSASIEKSTPILDSVQFSCMVANSETDEILAVLSRQRRLPDRPTCQLYEIATRALRIANTSAMTYTQRSDWCEVCLFEDESQDDVALANKMKYWQGNLPA